MKKLLTLLLVLPFYCMCQDDMDTTYMTRIGDSIIIKKNPNIQIDLLMPRPPIWHSDDEAIILSLTKVIKEKDEEIEDLKWFIKRWKTFYYETQTELDKLNKSKK